MKRVVSLGLVAVILGMMAVAIMPVLVPQPVLAMTGSGTSGDPWIVMNVTDLQAIGTGSYLLSHYYELGQDIDASATVGWNGGAGFNPIGTIGSLRFTGHLDGNGYTISSLYINRPSTNYVALFEDALGATIQNVILEDWDITGRSKVATMVANAQNTIVQYVWIDGGSVYGAYTGQADTGGLCYVSGGSGYIYRCYSSATVSAAGFNVGGFSAQTATIYESYCMGTVSGTGYVGGMVGIQHSGLIQNSYARGAVSGGATSGGLVGAMTDYYGASTVDNCYSTGAVSGGGGLIGTRTGTTYVTDSFWDKETSGQTTSAGGTGKTTAEMKTQATFTGAGWDFDTIWSMSGYINNGYPYLEWWYDPVPMIDELYQVVWFQPNAIIVGTTLPNRAEEEDGIITWGANPAGITISHDILKPEKTYEFEPIIPGAVDIIDPEPEGMTGDVDTSRLEKNPLRPLAQVLASVSGMTERLAWLGIAIFILIALMVYIQLKTGHMVFTSLAGLGLSFAFYAIGVFPLWVVILMAIGLATSVVYERMPTL